MLTIHIRKFRMQRGRRRGRQGVKPGFQILVEIRFCDETVARVELRATWHRQAEDMPGEYMTCFMNCDAALQIGFGARGNPVSGGFDMLRRQASPRTPCLCPRCPDQACNIRADTACQLVCEQAELRF